MSQKLNDAFPYCPENFVDRDGPRHADKGHWREEIGGVSGLTRLKPNLRGSNNFSKEAKLVGDDFKDYFNSTEGSVSWQDDITLRTINPFDLHRLVSKIYCLFI